MNAMCGRKPETGRLRSYTAAEVRIFLAGATGVIGSRLVPLLVEAGHDVAGMTRTPEKAPWLSSVGAEPVVCNVFDADALTESVRRSQPDLVMHQLTDLPDDATRFADFASAHNRIRREGTKNLIAAAVAAGAVRFSAQSVAWHLPGAGGAAVADLERMVLDHPGVVIRYGKFYGPGTHYPELPPTPPRIAIEEAAMRTLATLDATPGVVTIVE
jgi:uncharacterized protein YbjT (DUF2867 family)